MKNQMFKKFLTLAMVAVMLLGCVSMLAGCGKDPFADLTDTEYMKAVEKANMADTIEGLAAFYGALGKTDTQAGANMNVDYTVQIGDMVIDMLEESYQGNVGSAMDFSFLSNISVKMEMTAKDNLTKQNIALLLNNKQILSATVLMDVAKYVQYMAVPELNDGFIKLDLGAMVGDGNGLSAVGIATQLPELMAKLPSEKTLKTMLNRYIGVILDNLQNVTRSTVTLGKDDVTQECTAITVKITEADAKMIAKAVLETAKADQDLKKAVEGISEMAGEDLYPDFVQGIEDALAELNEPNDTSDFGESIELITYVDDAHNIIGRQLRSVETEETPFSYYTVTNGEKFTFKATVTSLSLTGSGTNKKDVIDGSFTLSVGGISYAFINVTNFKATEKELSGDIRIAPSPAALGEINGGNLQFTDVALEIKLATDGIQLKLVESDKLIVGVGVKTEEATAGAIEIPSDAVDMDDSQAFQNWMSGMDFDTVLNNLKDAGVPQELIDMLMGSLSGGIG